MTDVYITSDHVLLAADYSDPSVHAHLSQHLIISLEGDILFKIGREEMKGSGIWINSEISHTVESDQKRVLVFLIDAAAPLSRQISQAFSREKAYQLLSEDMIKRIIAVWQKYIADQNEEQKKSGYSFFWKEVQGALHIKKQNAVKLDKRIEEVMQFASKEKEINEATIGKLAEAVCLSKSRLSHLFKEETGIAFNSFLVSIRVWQVYAYMKEGWNITEAAMMAGFNSSAHFSATNKRVFGISAKMLQLSSRIYLIDSNKG